MLTQRFDSVPIRDPYVDPQTGFLYVRRVPIARCMVQPYLKADGSIDMEAKKPEYLLSDATVASANNRPVTNGHPAEGLVTKDNAKKLMKGFTASNAHVEGNMLFNDLTITDADLINDIKNGKRELSIGFQTEVVPEKGELNGVKYDSVQKNIKINHIAVVDKGRAGHPVRLLGDSAEAIDPATNKKGQAMDYTKVRLDGADVTVAVQDADKITKLDAASKANSQKIADLNAQIAALTKQRDALQGKSDASAKQADDAQAKADAAEKELQNLKDSIAKDGVLDKAKQVIKDGLDDLKGKSVEDIKKATIKAYDDGFDLDGKSDAYVDAMFDFVTSPKAQKGKVVGATGQQMKHDSADSKTAQLQYARDHMFENHKGGNK